MKTYKLNYEFGEYFINQDLLQKALRKLLREYFRIDKQSTMVHVTKAYWIIDWFVGLPLGENDFYDHLFKVFNFQIHEFFEDKARKESKQ